MNNILVKFQQIEKKYLGSEKPALSNLNFEIFVEEFLVIVGPSGCGKSTVLKLIAALEEPTSGEIEKPVNVAMVFQSGALLPWLNVLENTAIGLKAKNFPENKILEISQKYLEMVGLKDFLQKFPRELSGGQRQRVGIARALAVEPEVLLLDEPFSALDTITTEELHKDLIKIWQQTKQTIVMVSHSLEEAVTLADRILIMKEGQISHELKISLPRPRREQAHTFIEEVHKLRSEFFK